MPDFDDESLNIDNPDLQDEPAQVVEEDQGEEAPPKQGDLSVALRQEREKRREVEDRLRRLEEDQTRNDMLLQRLAPKGPDREELNRQYQEKLFQSPYDEVQNLRQQIGQDVAQQYRGQFADVAKMRMATHPDYGDFYSADTTARKFIDAFIDNELLTNNRIDENRLKNAVEGIKELRGEAKPNIAMKGKERATSIVDKGKSTKSSDGLTDLEIWEKAVYSLLPKDLVAWEKKPENQALIQRAKDTARKQKQG